jgi:ABC-2 type transport system permease protein
VRLPRWRVVAAIIRRDFAVTRSYRLAFLLDAFFGLIELAVYFFIAETIDVAPRDLQGAPSYFAFAAVGAVLGTVIYAATAAIADRVRNEQLTGTLEALLAQPLAPIEICLGLTGFPYLFALARALLYLAVAGVWMELDTDRASWIGITVVLVCTGLALSSLGVVAAAIVLVLKRGDVFAGAVVVAMTFAGGAVFPVSVLPEGLELLATVNPFRFAFDGVRAALFRGGGWGEDAAALALFGGVVLPLSILGFRLALDYAKRAGSLAQY